MDHEVLRASKTASFPSAFHCFLSGSVLPRDPEDVQLCSTEPTDDSDNDHDDDDDDDIVKDKLSVETTTLLSILFVTSASSSRSLVQS